MNTKKVLLHSGVIVAAFAVTIGTAVFQRLTGPTAPIKTNVMLQEFGLQGKLPRSATIGEELNFELNLLSKQVQENTNNLATLPECALHYKKLGSTENNTDSNFIFDKNLNRFTTSIATQDYPPASKIEYQITCTDKANAKTINIPEKPVALRFKGKVNDIVLIIHILVMFASMCLATTAGIYAALNSKKLKEMIFAVSGSLLLGGFLLGAAIQKQAFGVYWTGFPFGSDITDNKILIVFVIWIILLVLPKKLLNKWLIIIASLATLGVYLIPHSLNGTTFNYQTGKINK